MSGKRYTKEFKIEAVKQVTERGHPATEVAARLGVSSHLLSVAGRRIYISGDTDAIAEVRALKDIDIAFLAITRWPMSAPRGVEAMRAIVPRVVYPYHYESIRERDSGDA